MRAVGLGGRQNNLAITRQLNFTIFGSGIRDGHAPQFGRVHGNGHNFGTRFQATVNARKRHAIGRQHCRI